jgi:hypothetical protein
MFDYTQADECERGKLKITSLERGLLACAGESVCTLRRLKLPLGFARPLRIRIYSVPL